MFDQPGITIAVCGAILVALGVVVYGGLFALNAVFGE